MKKNLTDNATFQGDYQTHSGICRDASSVAFADSFFHIEINAQALSNPFAMLIASDCDSLDVDTRRRKITMTERFLRLRQAPCILGNHPRIGVARLVNVNPIDAGCLRVAFQIVREGM